MPPKYKLPGGIFSDKVPGGSKMSHKARREYQASRVLQNVVRMSLSYGQHTQLALAPEGVPPDPLASPEGAEDEDDLTLSLSPQVIPEGVPPAPSGDEDSDSDEDLLNWQDIDLMGVDFIFDGKQTIMTNDHEVVATVKNKNESEDPESWDIEWTREAKEGIINEFSDNGIDEDDLIETHGKGGDGGVWSSPPDDKGNTLFFTSAPPLPDEDEDEDDDDIPEYGSVSQGSERERQLAKAQKLPGTEYWADVENPEDYFEMTKGEYDALYAKGWYILQGDWYDETGKDQGDLGSPDYQGESKIDLYFATSDEDESDYYIGLQPQLTRVDTNAPRNVGESFMAMGMPYLYHGHEQVEEGFEPEAEDQPEMPDRPNTPWDDGDHAGAEKGGYQVHYVVPSVYEGVVPQRNTYPDRFEEEKKWQKTDNKDKDGNPIPVRYFRPIPFLEKKRREHYGIKGEMTYKSTYTGPKQREWIPKGQRPPKPVEEPFVRPATSNLTPLAQEWLDSQANVDIKGVHHYSKKGLPKGWQGTVREWMVIQYALERELDKPKTKKFLKMPAEQQRWQNSLEYFIDEEWRYYGHQDAWRKKYGYKNSDSGKIAFADPKTGQFTGWTDSDEEDEESSSEDEEPYNWDTSEEESEEDGPDIFAVLEELKMPSAEEILALRELMDEGDDVAFLKLAKLGLVD